MKKFGVLVVVAVAMAYVALRGGCGGTNAVACPAPELEAGWGETLKAAEVCPRSGYLCVGRRSMQIARWPLTGGTIRVRVRPPRFGDDETNRVLTALVTEGIRAWDGHPFPVIVDDGLFTLRIPDIDVVWSQGLYNAALGLSTTSWRKRGDGLKFSSQGLAVVVPPIPPHERGDAMGAELRTRILAAAIHEMGHALGLGHSDSREDIMFPQLRPEVTRPRPSSRDLRTIEALYALPNGAMVR